MIRPDCTSALQYIGEAVLFLDEIPSLHLNAMDKADRDRIRFALQRLERVRYELVNMVIRVKQCSGDPRCTHWYDIQRGDSR